MKQPMTIMLKRFWSPRIQNIEPYVPGEQNNHCVKLNTNEHFMPPSPKALAAMKATVSDQLRLYPDPDARQLCETLASLYGLKAEQCFAGNGSDEVLALAFPALLSHDKPLLFPDITYSFYAVYAAFYGIEYQTVSLDSAMSIQVCDYHRPNGGIILANPNAPTGRALSGHDVECLLKASPDSVVVVDEAYMGFGGQSAVPLIKTYPNLLVTNTLSKSYALAGLRVGYALGNENLIQALRCAKDSFNSYPLDRIAMAGACAALEDQAYFESLCNQVVQNRAYLEKALGHIGFEVLPSQANFIFARHPQHSGEALYQKLYERGILVRHFKKPRIEDYLRITIARLPDCQRLVETLKEVL